MRDAWAMDGWRGAVSERQSSGGGGSGGATGRAQRGEAREAVAAARLGDRIDNLTGIIVMRIGAQVGAAQDIFLMLG